MADAWSAVASMQRTRWTATIYTSPRSLVPMRGDPDPPSYTASRRWLRRRHGSPRCVVPQAIPTLTADQVVLSAGSLGTTPLLLELLRRPAPGAVDADRIHGTHQLGSHSRRHRRRLGIDYSQGVAITSSIHTQTDTHIEPVRYRKGSNVMGLLATVMVDGGGQFRARSASSRRDPPPAAVACSRCRCDGGRNAR